MSNLREVYYVKTVSVARALLRRIVTLLGGILRGREPAVDERGRFFIFIIERRRPARSEAQRGLWHVWIHHYRKELIKAGMPPSRTEREIRHWLQGMFLGSEEIEMRGSTVTVQRAFDDLSVDEAAEFLTQVEAYLTDDLGLEPCPRRGDDYYFALGLPETQR